LNFAAHFLARLAVYAGYVRSLKKNRAGAGRKESYGAPRQGAFAAAGFTDKAEGFAFRNVKTDSVYRCEAFSPYARSAWGEALGGEVFFEVLNFKDCSTHAAPPFFRLQKSI
jgi:hypothetical protein